MPLLAVGGALIFIGILAVYSVSIYQSFKLTVPHGDPSNYYYFFTQLKSLFIAFCLAFGIYKFIPLEYFRKYRLQIFGVLLILQLAVFLPGIGIKIGGAKGWINLGFTTIQPVEFFKIGWVIFLSYWLVKKDKEISSFEGFIKFSFIVGLGAIIFLMIPDLGSLFIISFVSLLMFWYQGGKGRYITISLIGFVFLAFTIGMRFDYIKNRIGYFFDSNIDKNNQNIGYQVQQGLIAIGGGGVFGRGYGKGLQKFGNIPVAQSDYIFAAFSEEIGFFGNMIIMGLYFSLLYITLKRLPLVGDPYFKLLALGIVGTIIIQALVNVGVNIKLFPVTGLTLPFISHGGSGIMTNCIQLAILYKILYRK